MSPPPEEQLEPRKNPKVLPSIPARKVLFPIPERTEEERQTVRANYKLWEKEERQAIRDNYELREEQQPKHIPPMEGKVADNIARDQVTVIRPKLFRMIAQTSTERLLADPALAIPTWEILMDNSLPVRLKAKQLQAIGWDCIPMNKHMFWWVCLLAEVLGEGIN